ncbi:hypothetical protein N500_0188 [Wolbachia pipientis wUni]|nr:hypothetical protein N500_0188 [Wolbachia pipientis wUni]
MALKPSLDEGSKIKNRQISNRVVAPNTLDQNFTTDQPNKVWDYLHKN